MSKRFLVHADEGGLALQWKLAWQADLERALAAGVDFEEAACAVASLIGDLALLKSTALVTGAGAYNICSLGAAFGWELPHKLQGVMFLPTSFCKISP